MASLTFPTPLFSTHHQTPKRPRPITLSAAGNGRRPWWAPLFQSAFSSDQRGSEDLVTASDSNEEAKDVTSTAATSFSSLTPEKARVMRRELRATKIWHDAMYHSAIASRLASPDQVSIKTMLSSLDIEPGRDDTERQNRESASVSVGAEPALV